MSITKPQPISIIDYINTHIGKIINQLYIEANKDTLAEQQTAANDSAIVSVLLISDSEIIELIAENFNGGDQAVSITSMTIEQFQNAAFDKRYTLGCFIDPTGLNFTSPSASSESLLTEDDSATYTDRYGTMATKLRDLFAEQSLLLTSVALSELNLTSLGYIPLTIETQNDMPPLISWQFNLYDYKQRPDWLNAKYWANPENFDKYRW